MTVERAIEIADRLLNIGFKISAAANKAQQAGNGEVDLTVLQIEKTYENLLQGAGLTDEEVKAVMGA